MVGREKGSYRPKGHGVKCVLWISKHLITKFSEFRLILFWSYVYTRTHKKHCTETFLSLIS